MNIICKNEKIQNKAVDLVKQLKIEDKDVIVSIRKLPKNISLQNTKGYIEFDEQLEHLDIYIRYDEEKYITLAHELIHAQQLLTKGKIDEDDAYEREAKF